MIIKKAEFITSAGTGSKLVDYGLPEFAFVGRSNVGKSSLINYLAERNTLAKTSSAPGRTRLINYFNINDKYIFVDLPGYGFAQAGKTEQAAWQQLIGGYLENSPQLKRVFVLADIRHTPSVKDKEMLQYLYHYQLPFTVVVTKADKLSHSQATRQAREIAAALGLGKDDVVVVSASKRVGKEKIWGIIEN
ncbi:MAG: ribosome biogenesis GTP-binding protein YihA/YsxC [Firmicutes bacterium]|nr:ribosome biogenesis GTP-binding protein YihA/YsxC [Bacillota bacterium]